MLGFVLSHGISWFAWWMNLHVVWTLDYEMKRSSTSPERIPLWKRFCFNRDPLLWCFCTRCSHKARSMSTLAWSVIGWETGTVSFAMCVCVFNVHSQILICSTENRIGTLPFSRMSTIVNACCNPTVRCIIVSEMYRPVCANFTPSRMRWSELNRQQFRLVYVQMLEQRSDL